MALLFISLVLKISLTFFFPKEIYEAGDHCLLRCTPWCLGPENCCSGNWFTPSFAFWIWRCLHNGGYRFHQSETLSLHSYFGVCLAKILNVWHPQLPCRLLWDCLLLRKRDLRHMLMLMLQFPFYVCLLISTNMFSILFLFSFGWMLEDMVASVTTREDGSLELFH